MTPHAWSFFGSSGPVDVHIVVCRQDVQVPSPVEAPLDELTPPELEVLLEPPLVPELPLEDDDPLVAPEEAPLDVPEHAVRSIARPPSTAAPPR